MPPLPSNDPAHGLYAHTPSKGQPFEKGQRLTDHLEGVADLAKGFAGAFDMAEAGWLLGMTHDLGKAAPAFQVYLRACWAGKPATKSPHAAPSATACTDVLGNLALIVLGHHAGLSAASAAKGKLKESNKDATKAAEDLKKRLALTRWTPPGWARQDPRAMEMLLRFLLSALTDADRLDTEATSGQKPRGGHRPLSEYRDALERHLTSFKDDGRTVTQVRREVQEACRKPLPSGFYRLTVPTGGGKTLASMLFALHHATQEATPKRRVVVAIPYTSIIEQNAGVFRSIFRDVSPDAVLEHHSSIEEEDDEDPREVRRKLAAENWDHLLVVTTNAQLFDSLFSRKPSKVRKLHRLAGAVIVLDEVQSLPADLLEPCLEVLDWLVKHAGATVVFCTATQPDYANVPELPETLRNATEIVQKPERYFEALRRVEFEELEKLSPEEVAGRMRNETAVLAILDTRKDALAVLDALKDPQALHLSTLMCPRHRRAVLRLIRIRLVQGKSCRVVSTQVVEAGVDLDFPVVLRSRGPLSSIIQAAGRCNREGKGKNLGRCGIFDLDGGGMPPGEYRTAAGLTRLIVEDHIERLEMPDVQATYFRRLLSPSSIGTDRAGNGGTVQGFRASLDYPEVDKLARLIQDDTTPVVIRDRLPRKLGKELETAIEPTRGLMRRLNPYAVSLRANELKKQRQFVSEGPSGILEWTGHYDRVRGIGEGDFKPPEEWIV